MHRLIGYISCIIFFGIGCFFTSCVSQEVYPVNVPEKRKAIRWPAAGDLSMVVDTVGAAIEVIIDAKHPPKPGEEPKMITIETYPVSVKNVSADKLLMGFSSRYSEYYPLFIEAVDSMGNWQVIRKSFMPGCGTGLTNTYLDPGDTLNTSFWIASGNVKTRVRVRFALDAYSDEFTAYVSRREFKECKHKP